jgi:hypothetical protein
MPSNISVENNFIGGLKTEFTGLNFPENACTAASNCVFSIIGDVLRREGIDWEQNAVLQNINANGVAVSSYHWENAGGDGSSQLLVVQAGTQVYFFKSSAATTGSPVSAQLLTPVIDLMSFKAAGNTDTIGNFECQYADGNGYLFVFHPSCDPFYVQYVSTTNAMTTGVVNLQIRDIVGIFPEPGNPGINIRPTELIPEHNYNLQNQGWTQGVPWSTTSTTKQDPLTNSGNNICLLPIVNGVEQPQNMTWTVTSGSLVTSLGQQVNISWSMDYTFQSPGDGNFNTTARGTAIGSLTAYSGTTMTVFVTSSTQTNISPGNMVGTGAQNFTISSSSLGDTIGTWHTQIGNYPSNGDIWWTFIVPSNFTGTSASTVSGTFSPTTMVGIIPQSVSLAPDGHYIMSAFNMDRSAASGVLNITPITTTKRPRTGCWFQGRIWYAGVDDATVPGGDAAFYTWTENIYFSQVVSTVDDFGRAYQQNDPTDQRLFDILPDDGGTIVIQGTGPIYKLFPIQNGILVFAANGIWLIRGNEGLGFTANDYSINKISSVKSMSGSSFVDVLGLPMFWNHEGIYIVTPGKDNEPYGFGGLKVEPLTVGTILSFYNEIPLDSKLYARAAYDPLNYIVTWVYRSTQEAGISNRYQFDAALNLNVHNRAFYPYAITAGPHNFVCGIIYVDYTGGLLTPTFKYLTSINTTNQFTFSEERDNTHWVDWFSFDGIGVNYTSSFTTGYKIHGQGYKKFSPLYITVYSRNNGPSAYTFQSVWDYATNTSSGKISSRQVINNPIGPVTMASGINWPSPGTNFGSVYRRHRVPGHGSVLQLEFSSVAGKPFEIYGWAMPEQINQSV